MKIAYIDPLTRGWDRMVKALFKPFDLTKWFAIGFTVFLAGLTDFHPRSSSSHSGRGGGFGLDDFFRFPQTAIEWLQGHPLWLTLIIYGIVFIIALVILLTWLSSRGKFMFLDNVVHDRALIKKPWRQFKKYANSLFLFRLCYGFIVLVVILAFLTGSFLFLKYLYESSVPTGVAVMLIFPAVIILFALFGVTGFIDLFLSDFVVPIMYKNSLKVLKGWRKFLGLLRHYFLQFIFYGLFRFVLWMLAVVAIVLAGIFTCCIGFLFLIIPYIGTVITVPISYAFRTFSLEFLGQFGEEFQLFTLVEEPEQLEMNET